MEMRRWKKTKTMMIPHPFLFAWRSMALRVVVIVGCAFLLLIPWLLPLPLLLLVWWLSNYIHVLLPSIISLRMLSRAGGGT